MEDLGISADYDNILFFLSKKNVEYLIVGGVGVRYYVKNREARDLDILINNTSSNIMLLQHAFHDFGIERLPSQKPYVLDGDNIKKLGDFKTLLTLSIFIFKIDIFTPTKPNIFNDNPCEVTYLLKIVSASLYAFIV